MKHSRAFTLLEMIVAIGIFAVIAVVSYASLNRFLDDRDVLKAEIATMKELQLAFSLIGQDMHFISERAVRDAYGDPESLLMVNNVNVAGEVIRFTTARRNISLPGESSLQRVAYRLENGDFFRVNWLVLDRDQDAREIRRLLLSDVESVTVNMLVSTNGLMESLDIEAIETLMPAGLECVISMTNGKQYRRVFEVKSTSKNQ